METRVFRGRVNYARLMTERLFDIYSTRLHLDATNRRQPYSNNGELRVREQISSGSSVEPRTYVNGDLAEVGEKVQLLCRTLIIGSLIIAP
jgi:hypothetical protein